MDYENKYKEALKRAKEFMSVRGISPDEDTFECAKEMSEFIFPELKSEDESTRKSITEFFKNYSENGTWKAIPDVTKWIAWLEKQGEQKLTLPKWKYKKDHTPLLRDSLILNKYGCVAKSPSGALVSDVWVIDYDELAKLPKEEFEKQGEQKSTWSEEDETTKNNISHIIRQYDKISKRENKPCWYIGDCLLWMQNIKDRVQLQPKQEWCGGDEAHLHSLITHLEQWIESNPDTTGADIQGENVAWLKSLRPQSTEVKDFWKSADGDDLPKIDREVVVLLDNGKIVFAHRPPEYRDGKDIVTGKVTRNYVKTYDKGGWNIPNVAFWLDLDIPKL